MSGQYDDMRSMAVGLLLDNAKILTLTRYANNGAVDPTKPWRIAGSTPTSYSVPGIIVDYPPSFRIPAGETTRKAVLSGLLADGVTLTPAPQRTDILYDTDGTPYALELITKVDPDGTGAIIYVIKVATWPATDLSKPEGFTAP